MNNGYININSTEQNQTLKIEYLEILLKGMKEKEDTIKKFQKEILKSLTDNNNHNPSLSNMKQEIGKIRNVLSNVTKSHYAEKL